MRTINQDVIQEKLAVFEQLQPEFAESFRYVQDMHGQRRFATLTVADVVRYLHALWVCEKKDRLLSVPKTIARYEGRQCLELLAQWQGGDMVGVVTHLQAKLDTMPFGDITRQIQDAQREQRRDLMERLMHGRMILLNRGMNLTHALDALFALPLADLLQEAQTACIQLGHSPEEIPRQIAAFDKPLYAFIPDHDLAQRNMIVMNALGVSITTDAAAMPGNRSARALETTMPAGPYAETVIADYHELTAPNHNNPEGVRFVDMPEPTVDDESTA